MDAFDSIPSGILQALAWIFTALAGVASLSLTIHKFGLSPWKRVMLIVGAIAFGLAVVLIVVPQAYEESQDESPNAGANALAGIDQEFLKSLIDSGSVSGMMIRDDGSMELVFATEPSAPKSNDLVAVELPESARTKGGVQYVLAPSGSTMQTQVGSETLGISVDDDNVIAALGDDVEFYDRNTEQGASKFKITSLSK